MLFFIINQKILLNNYKIIKIYKVHWVCGIILNTNIENWLKIKIKNI